MGNEEVVIPYEDFKRLCAAEEKLQLLIDSLLNNSVLLPYSGQLHIGSTEFQAIMMTFDAEAYKNCIEWHTEKEGLK